MQVHIETLTRLPDEVTMIGRGKNAVPFTSVRHTVEVTIKGERRAVRCLTDISDEARKHLTIFGIAVRFSHGAKVWPGSAVYWFKSGNVNNVRPDIDKSGVFYVVGFADDFAGKASRSQHNAVA